MKKTYQQPLCFPVYIKGSVMMTTTSMVFNSSTEIEDEKEILSRETPRHFDIWEEDDEENDV